MAKEQEKKQEKKQEATKADLIWDAIKGLRINMYSLPNQLVSNHVERVKVSNDQVHLKLKSTSVVASLNDVLPKIYKMDENVGEYTVISLLADEEQKEEKPSQQAVVVKVTKAE